MHSPPQSAGQTSNLSLEAILAAMQLVEKKIAPKTVVVINVELCRIVDFDFIPRLQQSLKVDQHVSA